MNLVRRQAVSTVLIVAIVVVVIVAGAGVYVLSTSTKGSGTTPPSSSSTSSTTPPSSTQTHQTTTSTTQATSISTTTTSSVPPTSSQSTSTTSSTTNTCSATTTQSTTESILAFLPVLGAASSMTTEYYEVMQGGTVVNATQSYTVESTHSVGGLTVYKLGLTENVTEAGTPYSMSTTAWVQSDGTVLAFNLQGQNLTGAQAESEFFGFTAAFYIQAVFTNEFPFFLNTVGVTSSQTSVNLGPTTMQVTDYEATNLPLTLSACGYSYTMTAFSLKAGPIPGTSVNIAVYVNIAGTQTYSGGQSTLDVFIKVTSLTKA